MDDNKGDDTGDQTEAFANDERPPPNLTRRVSVMVDRPVFTQREFDKGYDRLEKSSRPMKDVMKRQVSKRRCTTDCGKSLIKNLFPFVGILKKYSWKEDLPNDIIAGLTIGIMQIPQGMAYGMLAEQAPIYGLYISFFPIIVYFFTGTSRHISLGGIAVVSLMVGSVVAKYGHICCPTDGSPMSPKQAAFCSEYTNGGSGSGGLSNFTYGDAMTTNASLMNVNVTEPPSYETDEFDKCKAKIASAIALMTGLLQLGMSFLRMGFVTIYLSEPLTRGFITGAACHVFSSQVKYVFGLKVKRFSGAFKLVRMYIDLFSKITKTNWAAVIIAVISMIILYLTKEFVNPRVKKKIKVPVPIELIVVIVATLASHFGYFHDRFAVQVVGDIPRGIPPPEVPPPQHFGLVIGDCFAIAIVAFAISVSLAKLFGKKHNYEVDSNQELFAYGLASTVTSFFHCYPAAASVSRSAVQEGAGGVTQVAGLVSCSLILVVLLALGPLFTQLPNAVLAAVIIVALKNIFKQVTDLKKLWYINKYDFTIWLVVFLATAVLDVDIGLAIGIAFSLLTVVYRTQNPSTSTLGRVPHTDIYKSIQVYKAAEQIPGVHIFRFDSSLYYANKEQFFNKLIKRSGLDPRKLLIQRNKILNKMEKEKKEREKRRKRAEKKGEPFIEDGESIEMSVRFQLPQPNIHHIIVDCGAMGFIDYVGVSTLSQVIQDYSEVDVTVFLANCKAQIRDMLEVAGFFEKIDKDQMFLSIHDAVLVSLESEPELLEQEADYNKNRFAEKGATPNGEPANPAAQSDGHVVESSEV